MGFGPGWLSILVQNDRVEIQPVRPDHRAMVHTQLSEEAGVLQGLDVPGALIPVGRITGRVLLVCAGHDQHWASCPYAEAIDSELTGAGRRPPVLLEYSQAGHGAGFALPYLPELDSPGLEGSSASANPLARADEWPKILAFLGASG